MRLLKLTIMAMLAFAIGANAVGDSASVDYPAGYRGWQHVKSMIIQPGHALDDPFGGIHHVYGNAKAMNGLTSGQYENGAVFVFDLLEYVESDHAIVEADRIRIDVMQYNSERFSETDDWGYDTFVADSTTERWDQDVRTACYGCHIAAKESNYVFSRYRP